MMAMLSGIGLALLAYCATVHASDLSDFIGAHEGLRQCVYLDTAKPPVRTICFGLNVQQATARALVEAEGGNWTAIRYGTVCNYTGMKCYANRCPQQDRICAASNSTKHGCITTSTGCDNIFAKQLATFEKEVKP
jgi:hypothetical protein